MNGLFKSVHRYSNNWFSKKSWPGRVWLLGPHSWPRWAADRFSNPLHINNQWPLLTSIHHLSLSRLISSCYYICCMNYHLIPPGMVPLVEWIFCCCVVKEDLIILQFLWIARIIRTKQLTHHEIRLTFRDSPPQHGLTPAFTTHTQGSNLKNAAHSLNKQISLFGSRTVKRGEDRETKQVELYFSWFYKVKSAEIKL